ncbi:MAG: tetratricopeptide repeat protein [Leptolyngbya sp. SIO1E4]|nr:tetratricopeptide repeat protein [Leptolyngbya sp. SIO1E4]
MRRPNPSTPKPWKCDSNYWASTIPIPDVALSLNNLAGLYDAQGRYEEAEPLYTQALTLFEQILGPEHPYTQRVKDNLQILLEKKGLDTT